MSTPCLLALDTATEQLAVGLLAPDGRRWHHDEPGGALASARLVPLVQGLLAEAGLAPADLQAVAYGAGPGAFTGLRTACAVAQGLAFGIGCPVLAVDSLLLVAEAARSRAGPSGAGAWWAAVDARMDEVYAARYHWQADTGWQVLTAPALYTLPALAAAWQREPPGRVAGNAAAAFGDRLPLAGAACWPEAADRARALLQLAEVAWQQGRGTDPAEALPLYLRDKVALTTAERQAQRAAAEGR